MDQGTALLLSLFIGSAGFVCFAYGKKQRRLPQMLIGLAAMIYPYFVSSLALMLGVAAALAGGLVLMLKAGL